VIKKTTTTNGCRCASGEENNGEFTRQEKRNLNLRELKDMSKN
jgi:hypothetical protein